VPTQRRDGATRKAGESFYLAASFLRQAKARIVLACS
jgi:hypothetical protein